MSKLNTKFEVKNISFFSYGISWKDREEDVVCLKYDHQFIENCDKIS